MEDSNLSSFANMNKCKYHLHIDLEAEYEPLHKWNTNNILTSAEKESARREAKKHIDIWSDGSIYPIDPTTMSTPNFNNASSLLRFVGDGAFGLLGYCNHLLQNTHQVASLNNSLLLHNAYLLEQQKMYLFKLESANGTIVELEKAIKNARLKSTTLGLRHRCKNVANIETLKIGGGGLKNHIWAVRFVYILEMSSSTWAGIHVAYIYATDYWRRRTVELHDKVHLPRVMATLAKSLIAVSHWTVVHSTYT